MSIKLTSLNVRGMREQSKAARLLRDLLSFGVDVAANQETHFVSDIHAIVLSNDFLVYSAYWNRQPEMLSC